MSGYHGSTTTMRFGFDLSIVNNCVRKMKTQQACNVNELNTSRVVQCVVRSYGLTLRQALNVFSKPSNKLVGRIVLCSTYNNPDWLAAECICASSKRRSKRAASLRGRATPFVFSSDKSTYKNSRQSTFLANPDQLYVGLRKV